MSTTTEPRAVPARRNPLWWFVLAAFALQLAAWILWFTVARQHPVAEVPLETRASR